MSKTKKLLLIFLGGTLLGLLLVFLDVESNGITLFIEIFIILMVVYYIFYLYIMFFTKNVNLVEKFIHMNKKHPYYSLLISLTNGDYEKVEQYIEQLGRIYHQTKLSIKAAIQLGNIQLEEAEETIHKIKNNNIRNHDLALLALLKEDWALFENFKSQVKHKGLYYALEAEAAFIRNEIDEAEKYGMLAISSSRGLQKWLFVKTLEYQRKNENRRFFF